jgi:hypothetical protein
VPGSSKRQLRNAQMTDFLSSLNSAVAPYSNIAAVAGALFSLASFGGVVVVRQAVKAAVSRQNAVLTSLRASSECRQLLVTLSGLRMSALASDWGAVLIRSCDARRYATELPLLTEGMDSQSGIAASVITQLRTLERSATAAVKTGASPDILRVVRIISNQEDAVQSISSFLERTLREQNAR